uniref:Uncharacterized protein n=1 Tax=Leersia perrieri TaxID=77586 RepID=A0A0D9XJT6_9ORYZ
MSEEHKPRRMGSAGRRATGDLSTHLRTAVRLIEIGRHRSLQEPAGFKEDPDAIKL